MAATITKQVKDDSGKVLAVFYSDSTIRIDDVRLSFPHLDEPWAKANAQNPNPKKTFQCQLLLPKKRFKPVQLALTEHNKAIMQELRIDFVKPDMKYLRDGNASGRPEQAEHYTISTREERRPACRGLRNEVLTPEQVRSDLYAGCYVSALIRPWGQNSSDWGKRLNCGISAVRKLRDGEPFGSRISEEEIDNRFDDVAPDEENGGFGDDLDDL